MSDMQHNISSQELNEIIKKTFYKNLKKFLAIEGVSEEELIEATKIHKKTFWTYKSETSIPSLINILKISIFLKVPINELILPVELLSESYNKNYKSDIDFQMTTTQMLCKIINILEGEKTNEKNI